MRQTPAFISFTGADNSALIPEMQRLSRAYPVEWGILVDEEQATGSLFPTPEDLSQILRTNDLRLAAHVCGKEAKLIANDPDRVSVELTGFQRVQVNHSFEGSSQDQVENTVRFGRQRGIRTMLQCQGAFPNDHRLDWLFDTSFGLGKPAESWPELMPSSPLCGSGAFADMTSTRLLLCGCRQTP